MFRPIRTWLISVFERTVFEQRAEIRSLRARLAACQCERDAKAEYGEQRNEAYMQLVATIGAMLEGIEFQPADDSWRESPAVAREIVGRHIDRRMEQDLARATQAEIRVSELTGELAASQQELDRVMAILEVSKDQNDALWMEREALKATVESCMAVTHRRTAEAKLAARVATEDAE